MCMWTYWSSRIPSALIRTSRSTGSRVRDGLGPAASTGSSSSSSMSKADMEAGQGRKSPLTWAGRYLFDGAGGFGSGILGAGGVGVVVEGDLAGGVGSFGPGAFGVGVVGVIGVVPGIGVLGVVIG